MGNQQKPKEKNCRITMFEEYEHVSYNSTRTFTKKKKMPLENDHHMIKVETKRKKRKKIPNALYIPYICSMLLCRWITVSFFLLPIVLLYLHDSWILLISLMDYMDLKKKGLHYIYFSRCV